MSNIIETVYNENVTFMEVSNLHKENGSKAILSALELRINSDDLNTYGGDVFVSAAATLNVLVDGGWIINTIETPGVFGLSSGIEIDPHCYETELYTLFEILAALKVDCGAISSADTILNNKFTDKDQNSISIMNVSYFESKAEYMKRSDPPFISYTDEEAAADFADQEERGFIQNITCGTYNGATDDFTPWQITDNNILDTIFNALHEDDFYNFVAMYHEDHPDDLADLKRWSNAKWIREYTEVYEVFIIGDRVYVNKD